MKNLLHHGEIHQLYIFCLRMADKKGLVTSNVARTKPYLLTGWFPLREQFIYHVHKFPHTYNYSCLYGRIYYYTANKLHVGRFNFILYFALHNICHSIIDYEVYGKSPWVKLFIFSDDQLILNQDFIIWIGFSKINVLR